MKTLKMIKQYKSNNISRSVSLNELIRNTCSLGFANWIRLSALNFIILGIISAVINLLAIN